jgi:serine/threonine protein kinase
MNTAPKTVYIMSDMNCTFTQLIILEDLTSFCISYLFCFHKYSVCLVCYSLSGNVPFKKMDSAKREVEFPQCYWTSITSSVIELVKSMLKHDPKERIELNMILFHPWLKVWTMHCYRYYKCKWIVQNKYKNNQHAK